MLPEKEWLKVYEVAKRWDTDEETIYHYLEIGKLKAAIWLNGVLTQIENYDKIDFVYNWKCEANLCNLDQCGIELTHAGKKVLKPKKEVSVSDTDILITRQEIERFEAEHGMTSTHRSKEASTKDNPKVIDGLLKMLIAMAKDVYGYDPTDKKSTVTADIRKALDVCGLSLSENTIRERLKEASALLPRDEKPDKSNNIK